MIELEKNWKKAKFITHAGKFHADEVFSSIILEKVNKKTTISRVPAVPKDIGKDVFLYDIGFGEFDHHQKGGNGSRPASPLLLGKLKDNATEVKYATCGLLWKKYGEKIAGSKELATYIDETFIQCIDADDNGQKPFSVSELVDKFNPGWDEKVDPDTNFAAALKFARLVLDRVIARAKSNFTAREVVEKAIEDSEDGIMILDHYVTFEEALFHSKNPKARRILYAIYPSNRTGYNVRAVPIGPNSFISRKDFPASWAGLSGDALVSATGVKTATFCHNSRFLTVASNFEDALKLAYLAIDEPNDSPNLYDPEEESEFASRPEPETIIKPLPKRPVSNRTALRPTRLSRPAQQRLVPVATRRPVARAVRPMTPAHSVAPARPASRAVPATRAVRPASPARRRPIMDINSPRPIRDINSPHRIK